MDVVFANPDLAIIETDEAGKTRLPVSVIKSARRKLTVVDFVLRYLQPSSAVQTKPVQRRHRERIALVS